MSTEKHYLAYRDRDGLRKVEIFMASEQDEALSKYEQLERDCAWLNEHAPLGQPYDCCLFGSDSLATLCKTHSAWFAPETIDLHALCDQTTPRNPPNPSATVELQPTKED
jgi:hypothetical protein